MKLWISIFVFVAVMLPNFSVAHNDTYVDKSGFLSNSNRFAIAAFSKYSLWVTDIDGRLELPCHFILKPEEVGDKCESLVLSSVLTEERLRMDGRQQQCTNRICVLSEPSTLIGSLLIEKEESPVDVVYTLKEAINDMDNKKEDHILYRKDSENFYRYLRSDKTNPNYWRIRLGGNNIDYRIVPLCVLGSQFVITNQHDKSSNFKKTILKYSKDHEGYILKQMILCGKNDCQGKELFPASSSAEMRRMFKRTKSVKREFGDAIMEEGSGLLDCGELIEYEVYRQVSNESFRIELRIR